MCRWMILFAMRAHKPESLLRKHPLIISGRSRRRTPPVTTVGRWYRRLFSSVGTRRTPGGTGRRLQNGLDVRRCRAPNPSNITGHRTVRVSFRSRSPFDLEFTPDAIRTTARWLPTSSIRAARRTRARTFRAGCVDAVARYTLNHADRPGQSCRALAFRAWRTVAVRDTSG